MRVYDFNSLLESKEKKDTEMILTIGVFDGVHLGHQKIFRTMQGEAERHPDFETMCITFSINPKKAASGNLDTMRLREEYARLFSINSFTIIDFSENFSKISASGFASCILRLCKPRVLVVGADFKCGNPSESADGRKMIEIFRTLGAEVELREVDFVLSESGEKISSTTLRRLIIEGDIESYSRFSGQGYHLDLMTKPSGESSGAMTFSREQIHQLLPPPGAYEGAFVDRSKNIVPVEVSISQDGLSIEGFLCPGQEDSLYITGRKR